MLTNTVILYINKAKNCFNFVICIIDYSALFIVKLIRRIDKEKIIEYTTMSDKVNEFAVSLFMRLWVEMQQV